MDRKRKRNSHVDVEWTAAKCQRLLRPLTSRIGPLRKLAYITDSQRTEKATKDTLAGTSVPSSAAVEKNGSADDLLDPVWLPQNRKAQIGYSTRDRGGPKNVSAAVAKQHKIQQNAAHETDISLPTPFKARALRRGTPIKSGGGQNVLLSSKKRPVRPAKRLKKDPFTYAPVSKQSAELQNRQAFEKIFELHQGVQDGFKLLMDKTEQPLQASSRGTRSLMSTCLRKIPDYIQAEEEWRKSVDQDDDTDVTAEVYEELQELSASPSHGWAPLREVVRAHGMKLVRQIIEDGLVASNTRSELANMASLFGTKAEAEDLLLTHAHTLTLTRPLDSNSPLFDGCLAGLQDIQLSEAKVGSIDSRIRTLNSLYNVGKLRLSWMASRDMTKTMSQLVRSLASSSEQFDYALQFIHDRILQACKKSLVPIRSEDGSALMGRKIKPKSAIKTAFQQNMSSLVTVLTAIFLIERDLRSSEDQPPAGLSVVALLRSITVIILRIIQPPGEVGQHTTLLEPSNFVTSVLASMLIINIKMGDSQPDQINFSTEDLVEAMHRVHNSSAVSSNSNRTLSEEVSSFICNLSRCCGQSLDHNSQNFLEDLVQSLMTRSATATSIPKAFLQQVALESTIDFARASRTQESRVFARDTERAVQQQGPLQSATPAARKLQQRAVSTKRRGFRWEEGLCEWIAATPFTGVKSRQVAASTSLLPQNLEYTRKPIGLGLSLDGTSDLTSDEDDLQDSGYISALQETPAPSRKRKVAVHLAQSSPDILDCSISQLDDSPELHVSKGNRTIITHTERERATNSRKALATTTWPETHSKQRRIFLQPKASKRSGIQEDSHAATSTPLLSHTRATRCTEEQETELSLTSGATSLPAPSAKAPILANSALENTQIVNLQPKDRRSAASTFTAAAATKSSIITKDGIKLMKPSKNVAAIYFDSDVDELAMSPRKKSVPRPRNKAVESKTASRRSAGVGSKVKAAVVRRDSVKRVEQEEEDSGDELGA